MSLSEALCHAACQFFGMFHALDFPEDPQYLRKTIELCHHQLSIWKQSSIFHLVLQKHVANPDTVSNILYRLLLLLQLATGRLLLVALVPRDLPVPDHLPDHLPVPDHLRHRPSTSEWRSAAYPQPRLVAAR